MRKGVKCASLINDGIVCTSEFNTAKNIIESLLEYNINNKFSDGTNILLTTSTSDFRPWKIKSKNIAFGLLGVSLHTVHFVDPYNPLICPNTLLYSKHFSNIVTFYHEIKDKNL